MIKTAATMLLLLATAYPASGAETCPNWKPEPDMRAGIVKHCWGNPYGTRSLTTANGALDVHIYYRGGRQYRVNYLDGRVVAVEDLGPRR